MNTNLLWCKKNNSTNRFDKGKVREMIENVNIYLSRIIVPKIRKNIIEKNYFQKSFLIILKMHDFEKRSEMLERINEMIHSPTNITGILPGYLRRESLYGPKESFITKDIKDYLFDLN